MHLWNPLACFIHMHMLTFFKKYFYILHTCTGIHESSINFMIHFYVTYFSLIKSKECVFHIFDRRRRKRSTYVYVFMTSKVRFLPNYFLHQWSKMFTKITIIYKKWKNWRKLWQPWDLFTHFPSISVWMTHNCRTAARIFSGFSKVLDVEYYAPIFKSVIVRSKTHLTITLII